MPTKKSAPNLAIGTAIRTLRKAQGATQEAFALKAGLDRSYYGAIERGEFNITVDTLVTVADGLGVSPSEVLRLAGL
jgi:transcriptional regulator with XRE-family HTH domain